MFVFLLPGDHACHYANYYISSVFMCLFFNKVKMGYTIGPSVLVHEYLYLWCLCFFSSIFLLQADDKNPLSLCAFMVSVFLSFYFLTTNDKNLLSLCAFIGLRVGNAQRVDEDRPAAIDAGLETKCKSTGFILAHKKYRGIDDDLNSRHRVDRCSIATCMASVRTSSRLQYCFMACPIFLEDRSLIRMQSRRIFEY